MTLDEKKPEQKTIPRHYERKTKQKPYKETTKQNKTKQVLNSFEVD